MTVVLRATSRAVSSPVFASYRLHVLPHTYNSGHNLAYTRVSSTSTTIVETFSGPSKRRNFVKRYSTGTEIPRPQALTQERAPTQTPPSNASNVETFSAPANRQPYAAKHPPIRDLPRLKARWPYILAVGLVGISGWALFMTYVQNEEMISSSVFRQIMRCAKEDPLLQEALGDAIRPQPEWWLNGDPKISGRISTLQGNIDISFRIRGTKGSGTLYFTSIRKEKGVPFTILRFKVICDDGKVVVLDAEPV